MGKPVVDLKPDEITVSDNGVKQTSTSFRSCEAPRRSAPRATPYPWTRLRQVRLVLPGVRTVGRARSYKLARAAALDLVKGDQGTNVFYSVVVIDTRLLVVETAC